MKNLLRYLPPVCYFGLIFILTSIPYSAIEKIEFNASDKLVHFLFYIPFGILVTNSLNYQKSTLKKIIIAIFICIFAAACDEFHQKLIPGRNADPFDFSADISGAISGIIAFSTIKKIRKTT